MLHMVLESLYGGSNRRDPIERIVHARGSTTVLLFPSVSSSVGGSSGREGKVDALNEDSGVGAVGDRCRLTILPT